MRRKVFYQAAGQRHYYFMNVGNGEVIDACRMVGLVLVNLICVSSMVGMHRGEPVVYLGHDLLDCPASGDFSFDGSLQ